MGPKDGQREWKRTRWRNKSARQTTGRWDQQRWTGTRSDRSVGADFAGGGELRLKGLRLARPAGAPRVRPVIRPRSRWAPSPAIKMIIGLAPPAAPPPGPPGRSRDEPLGRRDPCPRPHCGPRRLRLRDKGAAASRSRPSGAPATQDEYPAAATKRARGPCRAPHPAPSAGPVRSQPRSLGSCVATLGEAERSAGGGAPPKARLRSGPPAARPAGSADRKSTRLNSSHRIASRMPSSA